MVKAEVRSKRPIPVKFDAARVKVNECLGLPAGLPHEREKKEDPAELLKNILRLNPREGLEIIVYWPVKEGKFEGGIILRHDVKKVVGGKQVEIEAPIVIEQIALLSVKRGNPESMNVKMVKRLDDGGSEKGKLITDMSVEIDKKKDGQVINIMKEYSRIMNYLLSDQNYWNIVLSAARGLNSDYADMSLREIGRALRRERRRLKN